LYSLAGLLLLPAAFTTPGYPRWLTWLGIAEWGIAGLATILLATVPDLAVVPLLISFVLYAPLGLGQWPVVAAKETRRLKPEHPAIFSNQFS
jgi:hypothetical protein